MNLKDFLSFLAKNKNTQWYTQKQALKATGLTKASFLKNMADIKKVIRIDLQRDLFKISEESGEELYSLETIKHVLPSYIVKTIDSVVSLGDKMKQLGNMLGLGSGDGIPQTHLQYRTF